MIMRPAYVAYVHTHVSAWKAHLATGGAYA